MTRPQLLDGLQSAGFQVDAETRYHYPLLAITEGIACCGPDQGARVSLTLQRDWLGELHEPALEDCLAELARRYLRAFAPATEGDFAKWSGLPLGEVRIGLEKLVAAVEPVQGSGGLMRLVAARPRLPGRAWVRLAPEFDNYLLGHRDRAVIAPRETWPRIGPGGGLIRATILADGVALGTWKAKRAGGRLAVEIDPFAPLAPPVAAAIEAEIADIGRFEGLDAAPAAA